MIDRLPESRQTHVIFNADGIYLATYATLLLNFELAKRNYYPSRMGFLPQSEVSFSVVNFSFVSFNLNLIYKYYCRMILLRVC